MVFAEAGELGELFDVEGFGEMVLDKLFDLMEEGGFWGLVEAVVGVGERLEEGIVVVGGQVDEFPGPMGEGGEAAGAILDEA